MKKREPTYLFEVVCPRCHKTSQTCQIGQKTPPPRVSCGDCLMNDAEMVEMKVVRVEVLT
jgi:transcription elongation factor Elf1